MLCLRINPGYHRGIYLPLGASHQDFTQSIVVTEKVGSLSKSISLPEGRVIPFGTLLNPKHCGMQIALRQAWSIYTDDQHITALGEQLSQFAADGIGEGLNKTWPYAPRPAVPLGRAEQAAGKGHGRHRPARDSLGL